MLQCIPTLFFLVIDQIPLDVKYKTEECNIRLLGSEFPYGFEYLNEPLSLVVTPLTERCFLSLTMSLKNYSCGTPFGSSGTGKTETIKELAKVSVMEMENYYYSTHARMGKCNLFVLYRINIQMVY